MAELLPRSTHEADLQRVRHRAALDEHGGHGAELWKQETSTASAQVDKRQQKQL